MNKQQLTSFILGAIAMHEYWNAPIKPVLNFTFNVIEINEKFKIEFLYYTEECGDEAKSDHFTWLKSESEKTLLKYVNDMIDTLEVVDTSNM